MIAATRPGWASEVTSRTPCGTAGDQVAEEREPAGAVLAGGDLHTEHLAVAVGIDTGRDKGMDRYDPATLTQLQHQRVRGQERERQGVVESAGAELFDVAVGSLAISDTWLFDSVVIPNDWTSLSIRRVETPSR